MNEHGLIAENVPPPVELEGMAIARQEAEALGLSLPDEALGYVLWNETGWPCFFVGDKEVELRRQLREAFSADV